MKTGMKAAGRMGRRMAMESFIIWTKASFMKASGWMEWQNVELSLILEGMKQLHQQCIQFQRYNILDESIKNTHLVLLCYFTPLLLNISQFNVN